MLHAECWNITNIVERNSIEKITWNNKHKTISYELTLLIICICFENSTFCILYIAFWCILFILHSEIIQREQQKNGKKWAMEIGKIGKTKKKKKPFSQRIEFPWLFVWWFDCRSPAAVLVKSDKQSNATFLSKQMKTHDYVLSLMLKWNMEPSYVLIAHIIWIGFSIFFIIFLHLFMFRPYIHRITCIKDHYIYVNEFGGRHRIIIRMLNVECCMPLNGIYGKHKTTKAFSIPICVLNDGFMSNIYIQRKQ